MTMTLSLQNTKKYAIALYIIIFTITKSVIINRASLLVALGICGMGYLSNSDFKYKGNFFLRAVILYGILLLISMLYTISPIDRAQKSYFSYLTMFMVVFFVVDSIKTEKDVKFFMNVFIVAAVMNCIVTYIRVGSEAFQLLGSSETNFRLASEEQNANVVGMYCAYGAIFSFHFILREKLTKKKKLLYIGALLLNFVFGLLTGSRKAMLLLFVGISILVYYKTILDRNAIKILFRMFFALIAVIALIYFILTSGYFSVISERLEGLLAGILGNDEVDNSTMRRMYMIKTGWKVFWTYPIIGQGISASYRYFLTYSHSNFIEILMNTGAVGFFIFYKPFYTSLRKLFKQSRKDPLYPIVLFVILWFIVVGFGLVFYYSKFEMAILAVATSWLIIKENEKNDETDKKSIEKSQSGVVGSNK
ncbi:MAG: O-antigen ligase family protein [Ruminococcaceae bacterium]|nr:O-antigen ligase family protein [Oscillospiraceae bacterium]